MLARSISGVGFLGRASRSSSRRRVWISGWVARSQDVQVKADEVVSWLTIC